MKKNDPWAFYRGTLGRKARNAELCVETCSEHNGTCVDFELDFPGVRIESCIGEATGIIIPNPPLTGMVIEDRNDYFQHWLLARNILSYAEMLGYTVTIEDRAAGLCDLLYKKQLVLIDEYVATPSDELDVPRVVLIARSLLHQAARIVLGYPKSSQSINYLWWARHLELNVLMKYGICPDFLCVIQGQLNDDLIVEAREKMKTALLELEKWVKTREENSGLLAEAMYDEMEHPGVTETKGVVPWEALKLF